MVTPEAYSTEGPSPKPRTRQIGFSETPHGQNHDSSGLRSFAGVRRGLSRAFKRSVAGQTRLLVSILLATMALPGSLSLKVSADGNVYYVSPAGSDDSFGSSDQPWRTIQRAANSLAPGDTVIVRAGTYRERVEINVNGSPGQPITFQGERGPNGEWLSIIDGGDPVSGWVPAPEVGAGVYKTTSIGYEPWAMTVDDTTIWRINTDSMNGVVVEGTRGTGFGALATPADAIVNYQGSPDIKYWDGIEALFGYRDGVTYIRFRNRDDPNRKNIRSSPGPRSASDAPIGAGVLISDKSFIILKGFWIRAARNAVLLTGPAATNNIIEENYLTNGNTRIHLYGGASGNHIRGNELKMNRSDTFRPGAGDNSYAGWITYHLYYENKFLVGRTSEDDHNIRIWNRANSNWIYSNHIYDAITGISLWNDTSETKIAYNEIHNHSAQAFELYPDASADIYGNIIYDNKYSMRLFSIQEGQRRLHIYGNRFYNPPGFGDHFFFNAWPNFYVDSIAEIYFYHNSIAGGRNAFLMAGFNWGLGLRRTYILNNILSSQYIYNSETNLSEKRDVQVFDYNWVGGEFVGLKDWFGDHNILAWPQRQWNDATMPDFLLPSASSSRNAGIDLSRPFTIDGRTYDPLPGMTPGYFSGSRPDMGAFQHRQ
jgi:Right handed beta helix region